MTIETKTTAELIDQLITACLGCWHAQDAVMKPGATEKDIAKAALRAQRLNKRRCELVEALNQRFKETTDPTTDKSY